MSNIRQQKWDWPTHLPKMIELYHTQTSIPDIHKAIQCEGFEPCQRSVYLKFKQMGFPTDPVGRTKRLNAQIPSDPSASLGLQWLEPQSPPFDPNQLAGSALHSPFSNSTFGEGTRWGDGFDTGTPGSEHLFDSTDAFGGTHMTSGHFLPDNGFRDTTTSVPMSKPHLVPEMASPSWLSYGTGFEAHHNFTDMAYQYPNQGMDLQGASYFGINTDSEYPHPTSHLTPLPGLDSTFAGSEYPTTHATQSRPLSPAPSLMDVDTSVVPFEFSAASLSSSDSVVNLPFLKLNGTTNTARNKIRSLFRPKASTSIRGRKRYAISQFTDSTEDSGYASGQISSLSLTEEVQIPVDPTKEFNSLYRVVCAVLHEPHGKTRYNDVTTCGSCYYSNIHNLAWSARYLKLEVFLSELKLDDVYSFEALDAAGNTALHYAAAGGASFRHLKALIDAGVDPYLANTAGELFIYCLRPIQPFTLEPNSDCLRSDDLLKLLGLLQLERLADWRDNDGKTIMHALALKISEPELKTKIFDLLEFSGFSSTALDRFDRSAENVVALIYDSHGQVIDPVPINTLQQIKEIAEDDHDTEEVMTCEAMIVAECKIEEVKQIKAHTIVVEARHQPNYVDTETGDNVFHALSRIDSSSRVFFNMDHLNSDQDKPNREGNYILLNLEYFISKGVDLNLYNRHGSSPLKSFICDRPLNMQETGATMSKYLDMILWKDQATRTKNRVKVNMKDRQGLTALYYAAVAGRPDSVRSLIEAGANVNVRSESGRSILQAAFTALQEAIKKPDNVLVHLLKEVISHLEHAGAVQDPTSLEERGTRTP
ncbi:hypothetical protein VTL71DRAFT_15391 [Oculimacula yallundae]|uniref:Ankyrin n=1 Tax=Oculimacula yallundae TaxID=86028 RepID=A0ABR4CIM2_9HELO